MSLFQARDWWTASIDSNEEFGYGSMVVANIDNGVDGAGEWPGSRSGASAALQRTAPHTPHVP